MRINAISFFCCSVLGCSLLMTSVQASGQFVGNDSAAVDKRVNQLIGEMTLDEKIDQMCIRDSQYPRRLHDLPCPLLTSATRSG